MLNVFIGWDPREHDAYLVACSSILRHASQPVLITPLALHHLKGVVDRPIERRDGKLWCPISQAPMATEFACSRFVVPHLQSSGWALFADCDIVVRDDLAKLFALADDRYAVMCVKHSLPESRSHRIYYDERCELVNNKTNQADFYLWPTPHATKADWAALELAVKHGTSSHWHVEERDLGPPVKENLYQITDSDEKPLFTVAGMNADGTPKALLELINGSTKMDGQVQTYYSRKNWSSVVLWNCDHPANQGLTKEKLETWPGRDLHAFKWLDDEEIGELPKEWNFLVGCDSLLDRTDPKLLHYTLGGPWLPNWRNGPLDNLWRQERYLALRGAERDA